MTKLKNYNLPNSEDKKDFEYAQECIKNISQTFTLKSTFKPSLIDFKFIASKLNPSHYEAWAVNYKNYSFNLCLVKYDISYQTAGRTGGNSHIDSHLYFFGHLYLKCDVGIAVIKPESIIDKITELIEPLEIDFKSHPNFSFKYYVLAENKDHFSKVLTIPFLDFMEKENGLQIEFKNKHCLFRLPKAVNIEESYELCRIGIMLDKILNCD